MTGKPDEKRKAGTGRGDVDSPIVSTAIGKQLKRFYDEVAGEPVPDRFTALLQQLEQQERDSKK